FLAIERNEIEGRTVGLSAVRSNRPDWLKPNGLARVLVVFGRGTRHADFPDVPTARELARNAEDRHLIEVIEIPYALSRPFAGPRIGRRGSPTSTSGIIQNLYHCS